tara:strand:- start:1476 stop:1922 length:447 start_codon:yes stop_codon:yes gene_type:complete
MPELEKWYVASQASDGRVFTSLGNTEPLSRRAAGLRTLEHLKDRAAGDLQELTPEDIEAARSELADELSEMLKLVTGFNEPFPSTYSKDVVLIELQTAKDLVLARAERGALARWVLPPLIFLSGAFAEGVIGVGAEKAMAALTKILSG